MQLNKPSNKQANELISQLKDIAGQEDALPNIDSSDERLKQLENYLQASNLPAHWKTPGNDLYCHQCSIERNNYSFKFLIRNDFSFFTLIAYKRQEEASFFVDISESMIAIVKNYCLAIESFGYNYIPFSELAVDVGPELTRPGLLDSSLFTFFCGED